MRPRQQYSRRFTCFPRLLFLLCYLSRGLWVLLLLPFLIALCVFSSECTSPFTYFVFACSRSPIHHDILALRPNTHSAPTTVIMCPSSPCFTCFHSEIPVVLCSGVLDSQTLHCLVRVDSPFVRLGLVTRMHLSDSGCLAFLAIAPSCVCRFLLATLRSNKSLTLWLDSTHTLLSRSREFVRCLSRSFSGISTP